MRADPHAELLTPWRESRFGAAITRPGLTNRSHFLLAAVLVAAAVLLGLHPERASATVHHVPDDFPSIESAVGASASGDSVVIAEGLWFVPDTLRIPSGLTLRAEGDTRLTEVEIGFNHVLLEDGPDTTYVEDLTLLCAYEGHQTVSMRAEGPRVRISRCRFIDIFGAGGIGTTLITEAGGVVEHTSFGTTAYTQLAVAGGDSTLVRYNTWNTDCDSGGGVLYVRGSPRKVELRNNTMLISALELEPKSSSTEIVLVNNLLEGIAFNCNGIPFVMELRYNYLLLPRYEPSCEPTLVVGPGNIVIEDPPGPDVFCSPNPSCDLSVRSDSPVANAGENGETIGAWPIGCGEIPVEPSPDVGEILPYRIVGRPLPNPSGGRVSLFVGVSASGIDVFDLTGRRIRTLGATRGTGEVTWDGRDDQGKPAPSGQYFLRVRAESGSAVRKVRIVR